MSTKSEQETDELARASADLARAREGFVLSMGTLEGEIARKLDWHEWLRRRPGVALGLAFGLGLFLGRRH